MIEGNRRFDIVIRLTESDRQNLDVIRALPVRVGDAGMLPLGDVADIERVKTVSPILRDSAQRRAALMVNLRGRDVESWVREAGAKVREHVQLPEGYTLSSAASSRIFAKPKRGSRLLCHRGSGIYLRADLHGVRQRATSAPCLFRRPARGHRRRRRALAARHAVQHFRCRGIHRFERRRRS